ncbi:MAG: hypothetical protein F4213_22870 [Boseongicola sp. SB0677_bin_26]|nr:hypothetical protein [Boseongicola sp. SB0665_bin_10]MYG28823.1 hypothetical protein [Boseongicola sp. SB0677_bin_26]
MLSLINQHLESNGFLRRVAIAAVILTVTLLVSAIWQKMVYTIPVLAVLLFLAAGIGREDSHKRNLDQDIDTGLGD